MSRPSTVPSPRERGGRSRPPLDVYLLPAVVGSGRGDVEEVLLVGRALARRGLRVQIVRSRARPLALLGDATFDRTGIDRAEQLLRASDRALTVASQFGITAADGRDEPYGRAGPWAVERAEIDAAYGPAKVLHVSLEEFARARPAGALAGERWREAGRTAATRRPPPGSPEGRREREEFVRLYRKFRALEVPNLLPVFPTFRRSRGFAREFPETVQCGPLWPDVPVRRAPPQEGRGLRVLWYASASSSDRLARGIADGLAATGRRVMLVVRAARPLPIPDRPGIAVVRSDSAPVDAWRAEWARCDLAVVSGSRSLLEAIAAEVPFLYFNGVLGRGPEARRHRPEKIAGLLALLRDEGVDPSIRRDLSDFARARRVARIVAAAARHRGSISPTVRAALGSGFPPGFSDGVEWLEGVAIRFAGDPRGSPELISELRRESRRRPAGARTPISKV